MNASDFTRRVAHIILDLQEQKQKQPERFIVSDVVDGKGLQYVDLVQEGGGVMGIALVGYIYVLEQMGIRFFSLAGTSAGSINTALLAALGGPDKEKCAKILEILATQDFSEFVDGGDDARQLMESLLSRNRLRKWINVTFGILRNLDEIFFQKGLNPGSVFQEWLQSTTGSVKLGETRRRMNDFPNLYLRKKQGNVPFNNPQAKLAIVATDITTETKVVFPEMAELYYAQPDEELLADIVRASMSLPIFFDPVQLDISQLRLLRDDYVQKWRTMARYYGELPDKVMLVDGGVMSNFPIDIFHDRTRVPTRPTFGVKLGIDRINTRNINSMAALFMSCFDGARNIRDFEFLKNNDDFKHLVAYVDTKGFNWLDFQISDERKKELFVRGAEAAKEFLEGFNWEEYKYVREQLIRAHFAEFKSNQFDGTGRAKAA